MFEQNHTPIHIRNYWPHGAQRIRRGRRWPRRMVLGGCAALALAFLLTLGGCTSMKTDCCDDTHNGPDNSTTPPPKTTPASFSPAKPVVLDYGNGWYHPATGFETISDIAAKYERDPALVAELNRTSPQGIPLAQAMIYIPPFNNRQKLRPVLARVHNDPSLIPRTPWNVHDKAAVAGEKTRYAVKQADPWIANKRIRPTIVEHERQVAAKPADRAVAAASSNRPYAVVHAIAPAKAGNMPLPSTTHDADEPKVEIASLTGEASLPSRAAHAGEAMLTEFSGGMAQTRQRLATAAGTVPAAATTQPVAVQPYSTGNGDCAWPARGDVITRFNAGWHQACHGIEIAVPVGTPVHAARAGRVLMAQDFITYGKLIVIDHGDGFATAYGYSAELRVHTGDHVNAGQIIALSGTAPHYGPEGKLFFQVRRNGLPVDPLMYLK